MPTRECPGCGAETRSRLLEELGGLCPRCLAGFVSEGDDVQVSPGAGGSPPEPFPLPLQPGSVFHGMEVLEVLGRGGMGVVYKARQRELDRLVALKILPPGLASDPGFARRFQTEARALAALNHPGIVQIHESGEEDGLCFLIMEYVDGSPLRRILRDKGVSTSESLRILLQICETLEFAHSRGVVHRDIKPENLMMAPDGRVKIADFGLAKILSPPAHMESITKPEDAMGSPYYMAPEQYESMKTVDHRADIFSLGSVFYEMLTGRIPMANLEPPSKVCGVDVRFDAVVAKAMERSPESRYQSVSEMKKAVEKAAHAGPRRILKLVLALLFTLAAIALTLALYPRDGFLAVTVKGHGMEAVVVRGENGPPTELLPDAPDLERKFTLRFRVRYEVELKQEPWILAIFSAASGLPEDAHAVILFPEGGHELAFASLVPGKGWGLRRKGRLPGGKLVAGRWSDVEIRWDGPDRSLVVLVDGEECFAPDLPDTITLDGPWRIGVGGLGREVRITSVRIRNQDE